MNRGIHVCGLGIIVLLAAILAACLPSDIVAWQWREASVTAILPPSEVPPDLHRCGAASNIDAPIGDGMLAIVSFRVGRIPSYKEVIPLIDGEQFHVGDRVLFNLTTCTIKLDTPAPQM